MNTGAPSASGALSQPTRFYTFGISHYCEKARWALDWHGIHYKEVQWPPLLHIALARKLRAPKSTVPIVVAGDMLVQGSGAILDWADRNGSGPALGSQDSEAEALERHADDVIGGLVRRLVYAEMLPRYAARLKPAFFAEVSGLTRLVGLTLWPLTARIVPRAYRALPDRADEFRSRLEAELDILDAVLADGRPFFGGDRFGRIDVTIASLLALFARPPEMPLYHRLELAAPLEADIARWADRPSVRRVARLYASRRGEPPPG